MVEPWFEYGRMEMNWLRKRDKALGLVVEKTGIIKRKIYPDPFTGLSRAICGQQISGAAHETIWNRLTHAVRPFTCENVLLAGIGNLRSCGLSGHKAGYILNLAAEFASGRLDSASLTAYPDDELQNILTKLPGIGPWTVEMVMIFTFCRKNILSFGDAAIRRGLYLIHSLKNITKETIAFYHKLYSPYASIASFYLWNIANERQAAVNP